jgi:hypothetical protein
MTQVLIIFKLSVTAILKDRLSSDEKTKESIYTKMYKLI